MSDPLDHWEAFATRVRERLEAGRPGYGDRSFSADPAELVAEVKAEVLDVCGWSYVLFQRLEAVRVAIEAQRLGLVGATPEARKLWTEGGGRLTGAERGARSTTEET